MNISELKVYIAAPFFNEEQLGFVKTIENFLEVYGIEYFSPRSEGVIKDMTPEEKEIHIKNIYELNIENMEMANIMVTVIDDHDVGTMFELGYFTSLKRCAMEDRKIITVTGKGYDLNVMLKFGTDCHLKEIGDLSLLLNDIRQTGVSDFLLKTYDCNPVVNT